MKTLLQINIVVNYGSTGHIAEDIGQHAIQHGWDSYIAYGRNPRLSKSKTIRIGTDCDVNLHGLQTLLFDRHGLASVKPTKKLIEKIQEIKPDIIHLHNIHGYYINYEILFDFLNSADIPVIWTLHDCWAMTGHCAHFEFVDCDKWKTQCYSCPLKNKYPSSLLIDCSKTNYIRKKRLFNSVRNMTLVPVSNWLRSIVNSSFLSDYTVQVINNGINLNIYTPKKGNVFHTKYKLSNYFIILGVAHIWSIKKGLNDFIKLSKLLSDNFKIVLVGLSKKQLNDLPTNILGIPLTENTEQLADLYSAADLFVNPTWEDNFPTTNIEALACGTPVVTYKTGGSLEAIDSDTGFIVEQGDINGILDAVKAVKDNGKSYYTKVCRFRAEQFYNKVDRCQDYIDLYNRLYIE